MARAGRVVKGLCPTSLLENLSFVNSSFSIGLIFCALISEYPPRARGRGYSPGGPLPFGLERIAFRIEGMGRGMSLLIISIGEQGYAFGLVFASIHER